MFEWLQKAPELGWAIAIIAVLLLCFQTGVFFYTWYKFDNTLTDWKKSISKHKKERT